MQILLDLDDCLNTFTTSALTHFCNKLVTETNYPNKGSFDICEAASRILGRSVSKPEFWDSFDREFWATVPKSAEFDMILEFAESFGRENVCILTATRPCGDCFAGKVDWICDNLPTWLHDQYLMGAPKYLCARDDRLLIDDSDKNIQSFREYGGKAILVPRAWNVLHDLNTKEHLEACFEIANDHSRLLHWVK
jgi:hypothetical protein